MILEKTNISKYYREIIIILAVGLFYLFFMLIGYPIGCIIERVFDVDCPTCGITRAWEAFLRGDFRLAFYYHPTFMLPPIAIILYAFNRVILRKKKVVIDVVVYFLVAIIFIVYILRIVGVMKGFLPLDIIPF